LVQSVHAGLDRAIVGPSSDRDRAASAAVIGTGLAVVAGLAYAAVVPANPIDLITSRFDSIITQPPTIDDRPVRQFTAFPWFGVGRKCVLVGATSRSLEQTVGGVHAALS
jgi:hypothetical protein